VGKFVTLVLPGADRKLNLAEVRVYKTKFQETSSSSSSSSSSNSSSRFIRLSQPDFGGHLYEPFCGAAISRAQHQVASDDLDTRG
jgi:hypothetical protein